jgi:hypothetical protein
MKDTKNNEINNALKEAGLLDKVKSIFAKFNAMPVQAAENTAITTTPTEVEPSKSEIKLADGTSLTVEGEVKEGAKVSMVTPDGITEVADGDYTAEDKTVYTVTGGVIMKISPSDTEVEPKGEDMPAMMAALTARLEAIESKYKSENAELSAKLSATTNDLKVAFDALNAIATLPSAEPIEKQLDFSSIADPLERHRAIKKAMK